MSWRFVQAGDAVDITYDWRIRARKPLLRSLSRLLKPVFAANHRWAMARGEESLALELQRRRARTDSERAAIPEPPPPRRWKLQSKPTVSRPLKPSLPADACQVRSLGRLLARPSQ